MRFSLQILFFLFSCFIKAQESDLLTITSRKSDTSIYERLMNYTALKFDVMDLRFSEESINDLFVLAEKNNDLRIKIEALTIKSFNSKPLEKEAMLNECIDLSKKIKSPIQEANSLFFLAVHYSTEQQNIKAFEKYISCMELFEHAGFNKVPFISGKFYTYACFLCKMNEFEDALKYLFFSRKYFDSLHKNLELHIPNTISLCYKELGNFNRNFSYNKWIYSIAKQRNDVTWLMISSGNLAQNYITLKEYNKAIPLLISSTNLAKKYSYFVDQAESEVRLAKCYLALNKLNDANKILISIDTLISDHGSLKTKIDYYLQRSLYYKATDNPSMGYYYEKNHYQLKDSVFKLNFGVNYVVERVKLQAEQNLAAIKREQLEKKSGDLIRNITILFLVVFVIILIILIRYKVSIYKQKQKISAFEKDKLEQENRRKEDELRHAEQKLQDFTNYILERNNIIEKIQEKLDQKQIIKANIEAKEVELERINDLSNFTILTEEDWVNFKKLFEEVFPKFITYLKLNYPQFTKTEVRLICLCKLNLSTQDLAKMLAVSPSSIRQLKYRLRKKVSEEDQVITQLLDGYSNS